MRERLSWLRNSESVMYVSMLHPSSYSVSCIVHILITQKAECQISILPPTDAFTISTVKNICRNTEQIFQSDEKIKNRAPFYDARLDSSSELRIVAADLLLFVREEALYFSVFNHFFFEDKCTGFSRTLHLDTLGLCTSFPLLQGSHCFLSHFLSLLPPT